ncbi:uncharacterized protein LOC141641803 [Silene latifolia]|uniref:uncharacterized protein LOC141641803 n=1 Tax=Silene latifolia TaxID=37657 RepID=UPI003D76FAD6
MQNFRRIYSTHGLNYVHNFHHFSLCSLYSTETLIQSKKSPNHTFADYLVNNLGFSHQQALSISIKLPSNKVNDFKFSDNANFVVDFLKQHDLDDTHIKKAVSSYPNILAANVDKTLKPKFKILQDQGFSGSDLIRLILSSPSLVSRKSNASSATSGLENLVSNVALLNNEYRVHIQDIRNSIIQKSSCFLRKPELFRNVLVRVEEELGIPRISGMFLYGVHLLCSSSKEGIDSKRLVFKSFGWTEYDVSELMRKNPYAFLISEENIRKKLGFLMTELGYKPGFLATHATLFALSLEKRMAPRHRVLLVLKEKGLLLDYNFYAAAIKTEKQFLKTLIEPFKEDAPGLLELYLSNKGCSNIDAKTSRSEVYNSV